MTDDLISRAREVLAHPGHVMRAYREAMDLLRDLVEREEREPLAMLQAWVDETWGIFADHVSDFRPLSSGAVLALQGDWFTGSDALDIGLVDAVDTPEAIFEAVAALAR